jgi:4-hydroxyacetophenone monooxygenase
MLIEQGASAIECREEAHDEYNRRVDAANEQMPWSHPAVANWFKNADGRIVTNSPWRIVDYWAMTREPDFSDYVVHAASPR